MTNRDVRYDYTPRGAADTADPGAVRALRNVLTNAEVASLVYDASGNLTSKTAPDGTSPSPSSSRRRAPTLGRPARTWPIT